VALPPELQAKTVWLRINLNDAPLEINFAYQWVTRAINEEFRHNFPDIDFDTLAVLEKIFGRELSALRKGALALLEPSSPEYRVRLADRLAELQRDPLEMAKGSARYLCTGAERLLVVVLDNCDKRSGDEQLTMFQLATWLQHEFKCLVVLPLRDVTYDLHRKDPPLDTALKQFVFRIEPPPFSDVLQARVRLALNAMSRTAPHANTLAHLKNLVQCDPSDSLPDHFARLLILHWFGKRLHTRGPANVEGFHRVADMVSDLVALGEGAERVRDELVFLVREGCLVAEHLRHDTVVDDDLVKLTAAGVVHLQLMTNPEYLAACAEDTWIGDKTVARRIAERLGKGSKAHFSPLTTAANATSLVDYLLQCAKNTVPHLGAYLTEERVDVLTNLRDLLVTLSAAEVELPQRLFVGNLPFAMNEVVLTELFAQHKIGIRSAQVIRDKTGASRGFAFVEPVNRLAVIDALSLDGNVVAQGRVLRIDDAALPMDSGADRSPGESRSMPPLSTRLFLGNLPFSFEDSDVRAMFAAHDLTLKDVYIVRDRGTARSKGSAFVETQSLDDAAMAIGPLTRHMWRGG
jgi:hypothetical protein